MPIDDAIKEEIQQGYRQFLEGNSFAAKDLGKKQMIAAIANTIGSVKQDEEGCKISDDGICVVEAGTGTGKTIAYLLSTLPLARLLGKQVVIATGTVALQEQLVNKGHPLVIRKCRMGLQC